MHASFIALLGSGFHHNRSVCIKEENQHNKNTQGSLRFNAINT